MSPPPAATAETAAQTASNNVKGEDAGPARKRLSFTIPAAVIDETLAEAVATLPDLLSVEAVLSAWVRDPRTLSEVEAVVEMAKHFLLTNDGGEERVGPRFTGFMASGDGVEAGLL